MGRISIIMLVTNNEQYSEAERWIDKQIIEDKYKFVEKIILDNTTNRFKSASEGLNYGAGKATGDILFFMHQDVYLWDLNIINKYCNYLDSNNDCILGVAGVTQDKDTITDIIESKEEKLKRGIRADGQIFEVETLDECFVAMKKERWEKIKFDEVCCDGWHSYVVDICYQNKLEGGKNILYPSVICHDSLGNAYTMSYIRSIYKMIKKYNKTKVERIHGCCVNIKCDYQHFVLFTLKYMLKSIIHMRR